MLGSVSELPGGTVTFLFTDIEGSTRLLTQLGRDYADALAEHRRLLRDAFTRHGGVEVDTQGDAFLVAFHSAFEAASAAAEGQRALSRGPIRVRMGLHTGEPQLTAEGYVGLDVHVGARIAAAGHGAQVVLSKRTRELVGEAVVVRDLGEHRLRDLTDPVWLFQLGEEEFPPLKTVSNTNLPTPVSSFVGREAELESATALIDETRLLTVTGPGGIGKTRFAVELAWRQLGRFPHGIYWIPLALLRDPRLLLERAAHVLGSRDDLARHIGDRRLLILFDNFEQVVAGAPALSVLLEACPTCIYSSRAVKRSRSRVR